MRLGGNCSNAIEVVIKTKMIIIWTWICICIYYSFLFKVYCIHIELTFLRITYMEQVLKTVHLEYTNLAGAS